MMTTDTESAPRLCKDCLQPLTLMDRELEWSAMKGLTTSDARAADNRTASIMNSRTGSASRD